MTKIGSLTANLKINLRMRTIPSMGLRLRIAAQLCAVAAWILRGRAIIELEPTLETNWGHEGPNETLLGTIPIIGSEYAIA